VGDSSIGDNYEEWAPYEKEAMEFVKGRVLDARCGADRHSLYLQEKGFDVLGMDILKPCHVSINVHSAFFFLTRLILSIIIWFTRDGSALPFVSRISCPIRK